MCVCMCVCAIEAGKFVCERLKRKKAWAKCPKPGAVALFALLLLKEAHVSGKYWTPEYDFVDTSL